MNYMILIIQHNTLNGPWIQSNAEDSPKSRSAQIINWFWKSRATSFGLEKKNLSRRLNCPEAGLAFLVKSTLAFN